MKDLFIFPLPPALNQQLNMARTNRYLAAKQKKELTSKYAEIIKNQGFKSFEKPVSLIVYFEVVNSNRDPDNLNACLKFILDAMKLAGIIPDDSLKWIKSPMVIHYHLGTKNLVKVELNDEYPS